MQLRLGSKVNADELRTEMQHLKNIVNLPWLIEKLEEVNKHPA